MKELENMKELSNQFDKSCDTLIRTLDTNRIRMILLLKDSKIEWKSQFNGDCILYNDGLKSAFEFTDIEDYDIFESGHSEEAHGWGILSEDNYRWYIKANAEKGKEIDFNDFKDSLI